MPALGREFEKSLVQPTIFHPPLFQTDPTTALDNLSPSPVPKFIQRLRNAITKLYLINAINQEEHDELQDMCNDKNVKNVATKLAQLMSKYSDESILPPHPKYPSLKRSTFKPRVFAILTEGYLQQDIRAYIYQGFTTGFSAGREGIEKKGPRKANNPKMTPEGVSAVLTTVLKDWQDGIIAEMQMRGDDDEKELYQSPTYAISKKSLGQVIEGAYRRVFNLSKRFRHRSNKVNRILPSVNDLIDIDKYTCKFATVTDGVKAMMEMLDKQNECWACKSDIKDAFLTLPCKHNEMHLYGFALDINYSDPTLNLPDFAIKKEGLHTVVFINSRFGFGLRSAPRIFETLAQAVRAIAKNVFNVQITISYLDDCLILASTKENAEKDLEIYLSVLRMIGLEPQMKKTSTEATQIIDFLGLELDSTTQEVRIPPVRIKNMITILKHWRCKKTCMKSELYSLVGTLQYLSRGVPPGRLFMRRLLDTLHSKKNTNEDALLNPAFKYAEEGEPVGLLATGATQTKTKCRYKNNVITLDAEFQLDISWWLENCEKLNGAGFPMMKGIEPAYLEWLITTDASDQACAGVYGDQWFVHPWQHNEQNRFDIAYRELYGVVMAVAVFGPQLSGRICGFECDNTNAILASKKASSKNKQMMHLLRALHSLCMNFKMMIYFSYIKSKDNTLADALSRLDFKLFHRLLPTASQKPSPLSVPMCEHAPDIK